MLPQPPTTAVVLDTLYGPQLGPAWAGQRVLWQGQPAWLSQETTRSRATATLTLPWLNAVVIAQSGDQATARALLDRIAARPGVGLEVPQAAARVFIQSFTGHDGDHQRRNATVTKQSDVQRLLADLRSLPTTTSARAACDGTWDPATATLTVRGPRGERTYAARFGRCHQVMAGTGVAASTDGRLLADIRRLVPNSGL